MSIAVLFTQTVTVETYQGSNAGGESYATPVDRPCYVDGAVKLVRDQQGQEVVSTARLYGPLADVDLYTPGSRVTVDGSPHRVIAQARRDAAGPASAHHVEVQLT